MIIQLVSCARKLIFYTSTVVPSAQGSVKIKKDKNENYSISVNMLNLTDPERLQPAKRTYVVWMESRRNGVKNLGQLRSSSGLFSSKLKASLNTVTSFQPSGFFVTAEDYADTQYPGPIVVLRTEQY
jgi:hypothetical protein